MLKQKFGVKELIFLLDNKLDDKVAFTQDEDGYLMGIDFDLDKLLDKVKSNKIDEIISYLHKKLAFLKKYGYEIEEIIYVPHLSIPDMIYVSFFKPVNSTNNIDWGEVLYEKK